MTARRRTAAGLAGIVFAIAPTSGAGAALPATCDPEPDAALESPSARTYGGQGGTLPALDLPSDPADDAPGETGQGGTQSPSGTAYGGQGATLAPTDPQSAAGDRSAGGSLPFTGSNLELAIAAALGLLGLGALAHGLAGIRRRS
ncbi:MAG TPA: hypothetical protein VFZ89_00360 [Solirubrobacteraceae bacterium]